MIASVLWAGGISGGGDRTGTLPRMATRAVTVLGEDSTGGEVERTAAAFVPWAEGLNRVGLL